MEYNEPLNLSIKKKPIAVVTPSSSAPNKVDGAGSSGSISNDADDPSDRLDIATPTGVNDSDNMSRSSPVPHLDEINACHNASTDSVSVRFSLLLRLTNIFSLSMRFSAFNWCAFKTHKRTY